jgi:serine phosphatase RsbU (regulator of sigma subunit)
MRLLVLENRRLRATYKAGPGVLSIGSDPHCSIHLPDSRISNHQVSILQDEKGEWWLDIVDTSLPTVLNRTVQKARAKLHHADEIEFGPFAIRLFMESERSRDELQRERILALAKQHGETLPLGAVIRKSDSDLFVSREALEQMAILVVRMAQMESFGELPNPILRNMLRMFNARRAWLGIRPRDHGELEWTMGMQQNGQPCDKPPYAIHMEQRCLAANHYVCVPEVPITGVRSAMAVPLICQSGTLGMLYLENDSGDESYVETHLHGLSALASCIAMPLENVLRKAASKRQAQSSSEQTIARITQDSLTPKALPHWTGLQVAAYRYMGSQRCCDLYDVVQLRDHTASILVVRVNAPQVALARCFAEVRAAFRTASLYSEAPHLFARALNWMINEAGVAQGIDLVTACVSPADGAVKCCVAGDGVRAGIIHANGEFTPVGSTQFPPIGKQRAAAYEAATASLGKNETLAVVTLGAETAVNTAGKVFGVEGMRDNLCDGLGHPPGQVLSELATDFTTFIEGGECLEDVTAVLLRRQ